MAVHRYGVIVLAIAAVALLVAAEGDTQALVPLVAVGVSASCALSQVGTVKHYFSERTGQAHPGCDQRDRRWNEWRPDVPLITPSRTPRSPRR
jgi:hypothetical protein